MEIKPILFNTEMVRAILDGRKTQTRRVVKDFSGVEILSVTAPDNTVIGRYGKDAWRGELPDRNDGNTYCVEAKSPCKIGDILWVRETWYNIPASPGGHIRISGRYYYKADGDLRPGAWKSGKWRPSIHMPREAARIFLLVKDVRVEPLQDMDEEAAIAEGFADSPAGTDSPLERFALLWDKTIKRNDLREFGYHANPWVWVIEFEQCEKPERW